jgi:2-oxoglutarate dehydrogenase complex dehydrogenase (E1) component-like enzyme
VEVVMKIEDYDKERATVLNALYCSVRSAIQTENLHNNHRIEWIENDFEVCRKKLEVIEEEMRVLLGDPFVDEERR